MKRIFLTSLLFLAACMANAQNNADSYGYISYSLPSTTITLDVEAVQETFYAGPYAKYAEKYLGIKPRMKDESSVQITEITMTPYVEADQSSRYSVNAGKKGVQGASVFKLSTAGLVTFADATFAEAAIWRFPMDEDKNFADKGLVSNLTSESTTLYRNEKKQSEYSKVAVHQDMIVQKTPEQKAAELANTILDLRRQRLQIVTGDTDATFSGEALGAAIEELTRLEEEYMTLFVGYSVYQTQKVRFDVIPEANRENQIYVAFRLSDAAGLVPADDLTGKPVVMEIVAQDFQQTNKPATAKAEDVIHYRIPAICTVKLKNGTDLLLQSRVPVYQLGQQSSVPASVVLK